VIWCLHGFLGQGTDWNFLRAATTQSGSAECLTPDLFAGGAPTVLMEEWAGAFSEEAAASDSEPILLGYSLGGRLALHALVARPDVWRAAVIVSAHLGLSEPEAREERRRADEQWAVRFEREPWEELLAAWDSQPTFGERAQSLPRRERDFDRSALAAGLRLWSLGVQEPLADRLKGYGGPVLWIAGERDARFVAQGRAAMRHLRFGALQLAPGATHRVPWEAPEWFARHVLEFVECHTTSRRIDDHD